MADNGLASFQRRFRVIPERLRAEIMPEVIGAADDLADLMRRIAPVDSGDLIASIEVTGPGQQTPAYSQPGGGTIVPENAAAVTVGNSDVRYPHLVEYGTSDTRPQPFFWPAWNVQRKQAAARIRRAMVRALRGQA